jgi:hypothetical protein
LLDVSNAACLSNIPVVHAASKIFRLKSSESGSGQRPWFEQKRSTNAKGLNACWLQIGSSQSLEGGFQGPLNNLAAWWVAWWWRWIAGSLLLIAAEYGSLAFG